MKKSTTLFLLLIIGQTVNGQNLIPNGSFEEKDSIFGTNIKGWINFPPGTAKFKQIQNNGVPAFDGLTQVELIISSSTKKYGSALVAFQDKGFLQTRLQKPLRKADVYKFSIAVRLSDSSTYAIGRVNVFLSRSASRYKFPITPNLVVKRKNHGFINNQKKWKIFYGYYRASGGEKYLILGNNKTKNQSKVVHPHLMINKQDSFSGGIRHVEIKQKTAYFYDNLSLTKVETFGFPIGERFVFEKLYFNTGQALIPTSALQRLNELVSLLDKNDDLSIKIVGHTDDVGPNNSNYNLALQRANSVKSYLTRKGIATNRIWSKGAGESDPMFSNNTKAGKAKNRRVEMLIVTN